MNSRARSVFSRCFDLMLVVPRRLGDAAAASRRPFSSSAQKKGQRQLVVWGNGDFGRLGLGDTLSRQSPTVCASKEFGGIGVRQVVCGGAHTLVLLEDGSVFSMGLNGHGQLGLGDVPSSSTSEPYPCRIPGLSGICRVFAGHYHSACIDDKGRAFVWGSNSRGQLGLGAPQGASSGRSRSILSLWPKAAVPIPTPLDALRGIPLADMALGAEHSLAVAADGSLYAWGNSANGRLGLGRPPLFQQLARRFSEPFPRLLHLPDPQPEKVVRVFAGHLHSALLDVRGRVHVFGHGRFWQLGTSTERDVDTPLKLDQPTRVRHMACGGYHTAAVTEDGSLFSWGANEHGCLGAGRSMQHHARTPLLLDQGPLASESILQVSCGWKHTAAVTGDGSLFSWGWGGSQGSHTEEGLSTGGQLGLGNEFDYWDPTRVVSFCGSNGSLLRSSRPPRVLQVSCGFNHSAAVIANDG